MQLGTHTITSATTMEQKCKKKLRNIFTDWRELELPDPYGMNKAIYMLKHQYTYASISVAALKHSDSARAHRLLAACRDNGFSVYLASLERMVNGSAENHGYDHYDHYNQYDSHDEDEDGDNDTGYHHMDEIFEEELKMTRVVDMHGNEIVRDVRIDEDDIIQPDPFDGREPDDQEYEGYTGNTGATTTHWYRDTVCVHCMKVIVLR